MEWGTFYESSLAAFTITMKTELTFDEAKLGRNFITDVESSDAIYMAKCSLT
jgi:hypothetical protein